VRFRTLKEEEANRLKKTKKTKIRRRTVKMKGEEIGERVEEDKGNKTAVFHALSVRVSALL
jgi:hypothetical protein